MLLVGVHFKSEVEIDKAFAIQPIQEETTEDTENTDFCLGGIYTENMGSTDFFRLFCANLRNLWF